MVKNTKMKIIKVVVRNSQLHFAVVHRLIEICFSFLTSPDVDLHWVQVLCVNYPQLVCQVFSCILYVV